MLLNASGKVTNLKKGTDKTYHATMGRKFRPVAMFNVRLIFFFSMSSPTSLYYPNKILFFIVKMLKF